MIGGKKNKTTGENSLAFGNRADAKHDNSFVINLSGSGRNSKDVSSSQEGHFIVSSKLFTISVDDGTSVTINGGNIQNLIDALDSRRRLEEDEEDEDYDMIIRDLQEEVAELNETIESMHAELESFIHRQ